MKFSSTEKIFVSQEVTRHSLVCGELKVCSALRDRQTVCSGYSEEGEVNSSQRDLGELPGESAIWLRDTLELHTTYSNYSISTI